MSSVGDVGVTCDTGDCDVDGLIGVAAGFASSPLGGCVWMTGGRGVAEAGGDSWSAVDAGAFGGKVGCVGFGCDGICSGSCALELGASVFGSGGFVTTTAGCVYRGGIGSGRLGMKTGGVAARSLGFAAGGTTGLSCCAEAGLGDTSFEAVIGADDFGSSTIALGRAGSGGAPSVAGWPGVENAGFASCVGTATTDAGAAVGVDAGLDTIVASFRAGDVAVLELTDVSDLFSTAGMTTRGVATGVGESGGIDLRVSTDFSCAIRSSPTFGLLSPTGFSSNDFDSEATCFSTAGFASDTTRLCPSIGLATAGISADTSVARGRAGRGEVSAFPLSSR